MRSEDLIPVSFGVNNNTFVSRQSAQFGMSAASDRAKRLEVEREIYLHTRGHEPSDNSRLVEYYGDQTLAQREAELLRLRSIAETLSIKYRNLAQDCSAGKITRLPGKPKVEREGFKQSQREKVTTRYNMQYNGKPYYLKVVRLGVSPSYYFESEKTVRKKTGPMKWENVPVESFSIHPYNDYAYSAHYQAGLETPLETKLPDVRLDADQFFNQLRVLLGVQIADW